MASDGSQVKRQALDPAGIQDVGQQLAQSGNHADGGLLAQLTSNAFFTAVSLVQTTLLRVLILMADENGRVLASQHLERPSPWDKKAFDEEQTY